MVINPLLYGLAGEQKVLAAGNWTWSYEHRRLRSVVPIREHVVVEGWDMLDQLLRFRPECQHPISAHDERVEALVKECQEFHQALTTSPAMREAFDRAAAEYCAQPRASLPDAFGAVPPEHYLDVLAEYAVNNIGRLPNHYCTAAFWDAHKQEFLEVRSRDEVRPHWEATRNVGAQALRAVDDLTSVFKNARNELSLDHDVPFVHQISAVEPVRI